MGMNPKKLQLDIKHRWNSTYLMLQDAIPYQQVLSAFLNDLAYAHAIIDADWEHAKLLCAFLKPFYDATNVFSGVQYVTSNSVLQYLYEIGMVFKIHKDYPFFKETIVAMEAKLFKYWDTTPILFGLGSILDPRLNLKGVESTLSDIEDCFGTYAYSIWCNGDQSRLMDAKLRSLFAKYSNILHDKQVNISSNVPSTSMGTVGASVGQIHSGSLSEGSSTSSGGGFWAARRLQKRDPLATSSEELNRYYAEPEPALTDLEDFDVLDWWKNNEKRYPVLSCIASIYSCLGVCLLFWKTYIR
ncbi:zinc finger BED domain-containing protein DAYSLEEPER-like [Papaver somniferum]|uniref:zinc finger BED domain-containing protein DAYSLEEPER-like n=1 Tax=Papaver somniferum TaxID=3469 RepID=UPI000E6FA57A|nr:zinc finger BED domain-containing protein DAYSLEEPER-like [Papaver somniferum]